MYREQENSHLEWPDHTAFLESEIYIHFVECPSVWVIWCCLMIKPSLCILSQNRAHAVFPLSHIWRNTDGTLFVYDSVNFNHFHSDSIWFLCYEVSLFPFMTMSVFYCFCNKLPQTSWFKTIHMYYATVLEVRRLTGLTDLKPVSQGCVNSGGFEEGFLAFSKFYRMPACLGFWSFFPSSKPAA